MELRRHLTVIRRERWLVIEAVLAVVIVAVIYAAVRQPLYKASARVLLSVDDPAATVVSPSGTPTVDAERNGAVQAELVTSPAVAAAVAQRLGLSDPGGLADHISVTGTDILKVTATDPDPVRARDLANGFANAYLEDRRAKSVASLQLAADELGKRLDELRAQLAVPVPVPDPTATATTDPFATRSATAVQYQTLYERQQQLLVSINLVRGAELIADAATPAVPSGLSGKAIAGIAVLVGLVLGLAAAFVRDQFDDRLRSRADVDAANGLPILADFPFDRRSVRKPQRLAAMEEPRGPAAEAARALRTNLRFLALDTPLRRVLVTSPAKGEGKSLVAANLAAAFAQGGARTVLVSGDLRAPRVDRIFGLSATASGFTDLITEAARALPPVEEQGDWVAESLIPTGVENLHLLPSGTPAPNPADLFASRYAGDVLEAVSASCDIVIIDTAPVLAVTDTIALIDKVDGVVLVNYLGRTRRGLVERAKSTLEATHARVLGVVLNGAKDHRRIASGYYAEDAEHRSRGAARRFALRLGLSADASQAAEPRPLPVEEAPDEVWSEAIDETVDEPIEVAPEPAVVAEEVIDIRDEPQRPYDREQVEVEPEPGPPTQPPPTAMPEPAAAPAARAVRSNRPVDDGLGPITSLWPSGRPSRPERGGARHAGPPRADERPERAERAERAERDTARVPVGRAAVAGRDRPGAETPRPHTEDEPAERLDDWDDWRTPLPPSAAPAPAMPDLSRHAGQVIDDSAFAPRDDSAEDDGGPGADEAHDGDATAPAAETVDEAWADELGSLVVDEVVVDEVVPDGADERADLADRYAGTDADERDDAARTGRPDADDAWAAHDDAAGPTGAIDVTDAPPGRARDETASERTTTAGERSPLEGERWADAPEGSADEATGPEADPGRPRPGEKRSPRTAPKPTRGPLGSPRPDGASNGTSSAASGRPRPRQRPAQRRLAPKEQAAERSTPTAPNDERG